MALVCMLFSLLMGGYCWISVYRIMHTKLLNNNSDKLINVVKFWII